MARSPRNYAFQFEVERDGVAGCVSAEGDALVHVLAAAPELRADQLSSVWCLQSANLIWGFLPQNGVVEQPWEDMREELASTVPPVVHPWNAYPAKEQPCPAA